MTTKIAIKPQSEYTADELRSLDEWAAEFVGYQIINNSEECASCTPGATWQYGGEYYAVEVNYIVPASLPDEEIEKYIEDRLDYFDQRSKDTIIYFGYWKPSSTDAPLWQLGMILEKASFELSVAFDRIKAKSFSVGDYTEDGALFAFRNPATVLAAILEVTTND